jgi:hypothetical protein
MGKNSELSFVDLSHLTLSPRGIFVTFSLTAVGRIRPTKEDNFGREKTIPMTSLGLRE